MNYEDGANALSPRNGNPLSPKNNPLLDPSQSPTMAPMATAQEKQSESAPERETKASPSAAIPSRSTVQLKGKSYDEQVNAQRPDTHPGFDVQAAMLSPSHNSLSPVQKKEQQPTQAGGSTAQNTPQAPPKKQTDPVSVSLLSPHIDNEGTNQVTICSVLPTQIHMALDGKGERTATQVKSARNAWEASYQNWYNNWTAKVRGEGTSKTREQDRKDGLVGFADQQDIEIQRIWALGDACLVKAHEASRAKDDDTGARASLISNVDSLKLVQHQQCRSFWKLRSNLRQLGKVVNDGKYLKHDYAQPEGEGTKSDKWEYSSNVGVNTQLIGSALSKAEDLFPTLPASQVRGVVSEQDNRTTDDGYNTRLQDAWNHDSNAICRKVEPYFGTEKTYFKSTEMAIKHRWGTPDSLRDKFDRTRTEIELAQYRINHTVYRDPHAVFRLLETLGNLTKSNRELDADLYKSGDEIVRDAEEKEAYARMTGDLLMTVAKCAVSVAFPLAGPLIAAGLEIVYQMQTKPRDWDENVVETLMGAAIESLVRIPVKSGVLQAGNTVRKSGIQQTTDVLSRHFSKQIAKDATGEYYQSRKSIDESRDSHIASLKNALDKSVHENLCGDGATENVKKAFGRKLLKHGIATLVK